MKLHVKRPCTSDNRNVDFLVDRSIIHNATTRTRLAGPSACGKGHVWRESLRKTKTTALGKQPSEEGTKHCDELDLKAARRKVATLNNELVDQAQAAVTTAVMLDV